MRSDFKMFDAVRVSRLHVRVRAVHGTRSPARQPRVGDRGTIVEVFGPAGEATYLVECVEPDGGTAWVAELAREELEAITPADPVER